MAIQFVGAASAGSNTLTMPSHQAGDLIIGFGYNRDATTVPTLPSDFLSIATRSGDTQASVMAWKIAYSNAESFGTWTNADLVAVAIYRSTTHYLNPGRFSGNNTGGGNLNWPAFTMLKPNKSWVLLASGTVTDGGGDTAPASYTNRTNALATGEIALSDSNATLASFGTTTRTNTPSFHTMALEIIEVDAVSFGGGGGLFLPRGFDGGYAA